MIASESLVLENNDYEVVRDVDPGEAVFINLDGEFFSKQCSETVSYTHLTLPTN